jgi:hypothetical protein
VNPPPEEFGEYWDEYVRLHQSVLARRIHFVAVSAGLAFAALGIVTGRLSLLASAPVVGSVPGFVVRRAEGEGSLPQASRPVLFAFVASLRMWRLTLHGEMQAEVARVLRTAWQESPAAAADEETFPRPNMVTDQTLH